MGPYLETMMLICFGASWPISLAKNIKARTARSMSIQFILLIILGYVAGITAKLISGNRSFVLVAYLINLAIVTANLVVYFINKKHDMYSKNNTVGAYREPTMENPATMAQSAAIAERVAEYAAENRNGNKGGSVFFGSSFLSKMEFGNLAQRFKVTENIANRSIEGLTIKESIAVCSDCLSDLHADKVFVSIGDEDLKAYNFNETEFLVSYEWLLYTIHRSTQSRIIVMSTVPAGRENAHSVNCKIKRLAEKYGCDFIDISHVRESEDECASLFGCVKHIIRTNPIDFTDAIRIYS